LICFVFFVIAIEDISSDSEENESAETKWISDLRPISDSDDENDEIEIQSKPIVIQIEENDQSNEEINKIDEPLKLTQNIGEPHSDSVDQDGSDDLVKNDHYLILQDTDEE
jgi:hypothetical protein